MARKRELTVTEMARLGGLAGGPARAAALTPEERSDIARMGGVAGGAARAAALTAKRRREIARKAAEARWGKKKG
ncbi:MAG: hypothetical protein ACKV22_18495 [Bryobacteraceae bacterium]